MLSAMGIVWGLLILLLLSLSLLIFILIRDKNYFRSRNVFYTGHILHGVVYNMIWKKMGIVDIFHLQYNNMKEAKVTIGGNMGISGSVNYSIIDLDTLKNIFVKDFEHFVNRRQTKMPEGQTLVRQMLIFLTDDKWKRLRSKMSPTFTTGKIKKMFQHFDGSSKKLVQYVDKMMEESPSGEIDVGEGYSKFTMDTIATVVCGMDSKAFEQVAPSVFEEMGKKLQRQFSAAQLVQFMLMVRFPKLADWLGLTLFAKETQIFFSGAIKSSIRDRIESGQRGNDFIQLMMDAREGKLKTDESELGTFEKDALIKGQEDTNKSMRIDELLDDDGIVANCLLFILAGFDTTQSLLIFTAYALAINQEVQDKLRAEVDSVLDENDGEFNYESLHKMCYLEMVINESLRFYPPAAVTNRDCTKDYIIPATDVQIKKGNTITVPIIAIHHDPEFYPNPEKFDPERFSPENKRKIHPYAFLPFGHGPRNCIGMRFALTEVKLAIAKLVHNFIIEPSNRTPIPMKYQNSGSLKPKDGMWLAFRRTPNNNL